MPWTLFVAGDSAGEVEHQLAARLARLLSAAKWGVSSSQMSGLAVNGPVHQRASGDTVSPLEKEEAEAAADAAGEEDQPEGDDAGGADDGDGGS
jgi:hypothetical protein